MSINNTLSNDDVTKKLDIIINNDNYSMNNLGKNQKINIELSLDNISIDDYLKEIIYIDNISRIMNYCNFDIEKEIYINDDNYSLIEQRVKKELDYYRIHFEKYSNNKELEETYLIEDLLNKIRYTNKCTIDNNKLLINNYVIIDENGNYTNFSKFITHIYEKYKKNYNKIVIYTDKDEKHISSIKEILISLNINIDNLTIIHIDKKAKILNTNNINKIRYMYLINNLNIDDITHEKNFNKIITINSKIDKTIKKINNNQDNYNNINSNIAYNIMNKLIILEDVIVKSYNNKEPIILINYALELINLLNILIESNSFNNENIIKILNSSKVIISIILKLTGLIPEDEI